MEIKEEKPEIVTLSEAVPPFGHGAEEGSGTQEPRARIRRQSVQVKEKPAWLKRSFITLAKEKCYRNSSEVCRCIWHIGWGLLGQGKGKEPNAGAC